MPAKRSVTRQSSRLIMDICFVSRRFWRATKADTAVEFAMIGSAFFLLVFGIFVVSLDQFLQMTLDDAVRDATRQVQIGNISTGAAFKTRVCSEFGIVSAGCSTHLQYSVQGGTSFAAITSASFSSSGTLSNTATFSNVTPTTPPSSIAPVTYAVPQFVLVQVAYPVPFSMLGAVEGIATENGTPSVYSAVATALEP